MNEFPRFLNIPLADWIDTFMDWVLINFSGVFDTIGHIFLIMLLNIERFFLWIPWWLVIISVGILAWRVMRKWTMGIVMALMLVLIGSFGYWKLAMMTLSITTSAVVVSLAVGIPLGILMAKSDLAETVIRPVLDAMQTMPSFVYLIPALMLFGLGKVPALFATLIYAVPPVIRLTNVGIRQVSKDTIEAARAFGASPRQILFDVQMPLAVPSIMVGINQTTMMALAMVVIASMIGARGLGLEVLLAINRIEVGRGFEAGLCIVFLAIIIDRISNALAAQQQKGLES
ncbi:MAG: proline/glycine betaine ABC transporter permease [Thermodesulfobacteriota bacterium]|nr:proline/glycine betaine ABC transporter permease [Thermodesulfobacteriota bacterium]